MGVRGENAVSLPLSGNRLPNADKRAGHKSPVSSHTQRVGLSEKNAEYWDSGECERGFVFGAHSDRYKLCQPHRRWCCFLTQREGLLQGRTTCKTHTHTDTHMHQVEIGPKRGKERYAHCAAGICDDRKAADSETQERRRRRRSVQQKIHSG